MADLNNSTDTVVWCQKEQFEISVYIFKLTNSLLKFKKTFSTFFFVADSVVEPEPVKIRRLRAITYKLTFFANKFFSTSYDNYCILSQINQFLSKLKEKIGPLLKKWNNYRYT